MAEQIKVVRFTYEPKAGRGEYTALKVRAGARGVKRYVPPAGEDHAFEVPLWAREVEVYVSPTGRSVRIFVDGNEVRADG
jgi:hypothetical protein